MTKLREVESQINQGSQTLADRDWMKQIMHLGGGGNPGEQSSIRNRLGTIERTIEASDMGANVTSFFKTSSEPIETSQQDAIFERINAGTGIITFYGHSSTSGFDFSIDNPDNYNNRGRYPYMLSLGCYSGDAFVGSRSISERFIFLPNKGAIAFAASKGVGYVTALGTWANQLYSYTGNEYYGQGVGDVMKANIAYFKDNSSFSIRLLVEQFALSGDPAFRMHPRPGPDLVLDPESVRFDPDVVPAQQAEFEISFDLMNLGAKPDADSVMLRFRQQLPNGEVVALTERRFAAPGYRNAITTTLPNAGLRAVGLNRLLITVDPENAIPEAPMPTAEGNNALLVGGREGAPFTVIANTARTAWPANFAAIGGKIELIASTTDPLAEEREYIIQVATDRKFRNRIDETRLTSPGGVIRYEPGFAPTDSTTYYWRVSPDSTQTEGAGFLWSESSFTWVTAMGGEGTNWAMQDAGQTIAGEFENLRADTVNFGWNFSRNATDITQFNAVYRDRRMPRFEYRGQRFADTHRWRVRAGLQVAVIDTLRNTTGFWLTNPNDGSYNQVGDWNKIWSFDTRTQPGRDGFIRFMNEAVEEGKFVFVYSSPAG